MGENCFVSFGVEWSFLEPGLWSRLTCAQSARPQEKDRRGSMEEQELRWNGVEERGFIVSTEGKTFESRLWKEANQKDCNGSGIVVVG